MVETSVLLVIAVLLVLYSVRELSPEAWRPGTHWLRQPSGPTSLKTTVAVATAPSLTTSRVLTLWAPLAVVTGAFVLRIVQLTGVPYGFFCDEASPALDAYFIVHTLHDQHGAFLPAYFQALGEWPGGFQTYWDVPFVALFGLTEFASRFAAVVAGTLTIWLTYFFVSKATKSRVIGLIAAFLLATSPWHIMQSREGWQVINLPLIIALILACLYLGLERPRWLPLAFVCSALGFYGYFPGRVFLPLFTVAWMIIYARPLLRQWRMTLIGIVAALVMLIPTAIALINGTAFARLNQFSAAPQPFGQRISTYLSNYLAHYSPDFLFNTSDWITRHFVRGFGLLYPIEAPFILLGLGVMLWRRRRFDLLCLVWIVIYPVAGALVGPPLLTRAIPGLIVLHIAAAQGVYAVVLGLSQLPRLRLHRAALVPALSALLVLVGVGATGQFMGSYLNDYPLYSAGWDGWQSGAKEITAYFVAHHSAYDEELMNAEFNAPDELLRFYATPYAWPCPTCTITNVADPNAVRGQYAPRLRQLWAVSPGVLQTSALLNVPHRVVGHITYPNGQTSFLFIATGSRGA